MGILIYIMGRPDRVKYGATLILYIRHVDNYNSSVDPTAQSEFMTFHLVRTHLGWVGGVKPPIHSHCVLHAKRGWVGPYSM